jgi:hypothetical protein
MAPALGLSRGWGSPATRVSVDLDARMPTPSPAAPTCRSAAGFPGGAGSAVPPGAVAPWHARCSGCNHLRPGTAQRP